MQTTIRRFDFLDQLEFFEAKEYHADFPLHLHDTICLTLLTEGTECTQVHQQELHTPYQGISLTYPEEIHANPNKNNGSYSFLTYYISPEVLAHVHGNEPYYFKERVIEDEQLYHWLFHFAKQSTPTEASFNKILKHLCHHHFSSAANHTIGEELSTLDFTEVIHLIDQQFAESLSVEQLAKRKDMSVYRFIRQFKKIKGITPNQYITLKRVEAAKKLLRDGHPIADAIYDTGFYDQSHLNRNFKKITGMTPRRYQKACNSVQES